VCARGDGNFWGQKKTLAIGFTELHRENLVAFDFPVLLCVPCGKCLSMAATKNSPEGATFAVKIHPRAKRDAITGEVGNALKLSLTAPPVDGKANEACIEFFAKLLNLPRSSITIAAGQTSRNKVIRVAGLSAEEIRRRLKI
jgi:uncharacterized protein (TIGR00251 family)